MDRHSLQMVWPHPRLMGSLLACRSNVFSQTGQDRYSVHCGAWIGIIAD